MLKKIKVVGIFLLLGCLLSSSAARITEAAPTPDQLLTKLQARLDNILSAAENKMNRLSLRVTREVNRFKSGDISRERLSSVSHRLENNFVRARAKFDMKINTVEHNAKRELLRIGADTSFIIKASEKGDKVELAIEIKSNVIEEFFKLIECLVSASPYV